MKSLCIVLVLFLSGCGHTPFTDQIDCALLPMFGDACARIDAAKSKKGE